MEIHEYAMMFPPATIVELEKMAEDIATRGLVNPIITLDGKILDGRNRLKACEIAGVEPRFVKYAGSNPLADVISWNLHRRHLTVSQLAVLATKLKGAYEAEAKERQREGGRDKVRANLPEPSAGRSRDQAAAAVGISGRTVQDAERVKRIAPDVFAKIGTEDDEGREFTVNAAKKEVMKREEHKPVMTKKQAALMRPRVGMKYAGIAIGNLEQIKSNDEERDQAFALVKGWITEHES